MVWEHFTKVDSVDTLHPKCYCNYYHAQFACDGKSNGTPPLIYHIKTTCRSVPRVGDNKGQKNLVFTTTSESEASNTLIAWTFNKDECRKALARMLIIDELPFSFVEGEGFLEFCQKMCPSFEVPSRRTICRDVLNLYGDTKDYLKTMFSNCLHGVCLTTDTWTSCQNINYMVLTAHFIDNDWKLHKRILNFCVITSHKGENIGKLLVSCIKQWELKRIVSITVDNASANEVALNYVRNALNDNDGSNGCVLNGEFLHVRCCAHIVNLIVNDGLKEIGSTIVGIRTAVRFVRSSPSRLAKFKELSVNLGMDGKSMLALDVPTRWNSTYLMLETALKYKRVFDEMKESDGIYIAYFTNENEAPNSLDWKNAEFFVKILKVFYEITLKFSSTLSITSNVCFAELSGIQEELNELIEKVDYNLSRMARSMKDKFDKYWGNIGSMNKVLFITCVLDPRYKLHFVKTCLEDMYGKEVAKDILAELKSILVRFFDYYATDSTFGIQTWDEPPPSSHASSGSTGSSGSRRMNTFLQEVQELDNETNELERYLNDPFEKQTCNFDILLWWKVNSPKYQILSLVARDLLAIPVSTVASESAFSTGGRVIDPFRSTLSPRMVEALVTTQNWIRSKPIFVDHRIEVPLDDVNYYDVVFSDFVNGRDSITSLTTESPTDIPSPSTGHR